MDSTTKPRHTARAVRLAEIIIPEGIDKRGRASRISTAYGDKTREGIADLIDSETGAGELAEALREVLDWTHGDAEAGLDPREDAECIAARIASISATLAKYAPTP